MTSKVFPVKIVRKMKRKHHKEALAWYCLDFSHTLALSIFFMSMKKINKFLLCIGSLVLVLGFFFFFVSVCRLLVS